MNNTIISALNEQFYIDCKVVSTKREYPSYTGIEKWIIITDLTEKELNERYAEQVTLFFGLMFICAIFVLNIPCKGST